MSPCTFLVITALSGWPSTLCRSQDSPPQAPPPKTVTVTVAEFAGGDRDTGRYIADLLLAELAVSPRLRLAERTALSHVLAEMKLQATGVGDPQRARKPGSVAASDYLVTGSYVERSGRIELTSRVLDVRTGLVLADGAFQTSARAGRITSAVYSAAKSIHRLLTGTELDIAVGTPAPKKAVSLVPENLDPSSFVTERELDQLVSRLRSYSAAMGGAPSTALEPAGPLTNIRVLAAVVKALVPPDKLARLAGARQPPPDIEDVPLWGRPYVYTAQREGWLPSMQPVRSAQLAKWGALLSLLERIVLFPRESQDSGKSAG